jgi:hypothetical protein
MGLACTGLAAAGDMALVKLFEKGPKTNTHLEQVFFFALYASGFFVFVVGMTAWLRSRGQRPWIARTMAAAILFLVTAGPWVIAAIGGAFTHRSDDTWLVAAPSPFFAVYMVAWLDSSTPDLPVVQIGAACSFGWALTGIALLAVATRRCRRVTRAEDAAAAEAEAVLRAEAPIAP